MSKTDPLDEAFFKDFLIVELSKSDFLSFLTAVLYFDKGGILLVLLGVVKKSIGFLDAAAFVVDGGSLFAVTTFFATLSFKDLLRAETILFFSAFPTEDVDLTNFPTDEDDFFKTLESFAFPTDDTYFFNTLDSPFPTDEDDFLRILESLPAVAFLVPLTDVTFFLSFGSFFSNGDDGISSVKGSDD